MEAYKTIQVKGQTRVTEDVKNVGDRFTIKVVVRLDTSYWAQSSARVGVWRPAQLDWSTLFTLTPTKENWAGSWNDEAAVEILTTRAVDLLATY